MLHFNQRNWLKMFPDEIAVDAGNGAAGHTLPEQLPVQLPEPKNRKEFYLSLLAGHTPTKKQVLFSGYGKYQVVKMNISGVHRETPAIIVQVSGVDENTIVMLGDQEYTYAANILSWVDVAYSFLIAANTSEIWIHVASEADASQKVVVYNIVEWTPPEPKTVTEFYLAKMAGVEVATYETVLEKELTFVPSYKQGNYLAEIGEGSRDDSIYLDELLHNEQCFMDGVILNNATVEADNLQVVISDGMMYFHTIAASCAETTHTVKFVEKTIIKDVPVKTRTEQYLKAIAANQDSSSQPESDAGSVIAQ